MATEITPVNNPGPNPNKFNYSVYSTPGISVDQLDAMAKSFFSATGLTGWVLVIFTGIKLIVALAYIWARFKLNNIKQMIENQQYQQSQANDAKNSIDGDDLDNGLSKS